MRNKYSLDLHLHRGCYLPSVLLPHHQASVRKAGMGVTAAVPASRVRCCGCGAGLGCRHPLLGPHAARATCYPCCRTSPRVCAVCVQVLVLLAPLSLAGTLYSNANTSRLTKVRCRAVRQLPPGYTLPPFSLVSTVCLTRQHRARPCTPPPLLCGFQYPLLHAAMLCQRGTVSQYQRTSYFWNASL